MSEGPWDMPAPRTGDEGPPEGSTPEAPALPVALYSDGQSGAVIDVTLVLIEDAPACLLLRSEGLSVEWPLAQLRKLPDQAGTGKTDGRATLVLCCDTAPLARLVVHHRGAIETILARAPALSRAAPVRGLGRIAAWAVGAVASVLLIIFALVPLMADQLAGFLPAEGEKALGDKTYAQIRAALGTDYFPLDECGDPAGLAAFTTMTDRLVAEAGLETEITFNVLDSDLVNAFALPGGRIVVFSGLIYESESPDEVAAVLAHEIGHVAHRDPTRAALRTAGSFGILGLLFGDFAGGTVVLMLANQVIEANYSQAAEAAADRYAFDLLPRVGVSPANLASLFEYLQDEYGDDSGLVKHFSSHPALGDRIAQARGAEAALGQRFEPILSARAADDFYGICDVYLDPVENGLSDFFSKIDRWLGDDTESGN